MKNGKLLLLVPALAMLSILLTACGAAKEANFPTGKFINFSDPNHHGMIFYDDGSYAAIEGESEKVIVRGNYSVDGDTFTDESENMGCPAMKFKYTFDGTDLTFNYVDNPADDTCGDHRRPTFDNVTYTLSK